jgi:hypothetical protein
MMWPPVPPPAMRTRNAAKLPPFVSGFTDPQFLIFAEHAVRARGVLDAAGATGATGRRCIGVVAGAFCDCARTSADKPFHSSTALGADFDGGVRHFLALLELRCAGIA